MAVRQKHEGENFGVATRKPQPGTGQMWTSGIPDIQGVCSGDQVCHAVQNTHTRLRGRGRCTG
eukprot:12923462-Prorocentrum_lima.AAC.1